MENLLSAYTQYPVEQLGTRAKDMLQQILEYNAADLENSLRIMLVKVPYNLKVTLNRKVILLGIAFSGKNVSCRIVRFEDLRI